MNRIFLIAALFAAPALTATTALAEIDTDGLIANYQSEGYTTIEVTRGLNQTKVEAIRNTEKVEVVYDNATGTALKSEFGTAEAGDDIRDGVSVRNRNRDFVRGGDDGSSSDDSSASDDDGNDDKGRGRGRGRNGDDDRGGKGRGGDDRGGDDRGGDDRGGDDHGGDDHGSDD